MCIHYGYSEYKNYYNIDLILSDYFKVSQSSIIHNKYKLNIYSYVSVTEIASGQDHDIKPLFSQIINSTDSIKMINLEAGTYLIEVNYLLTINNC
jgi:hypothetical protein